MLADKTTCPLLRCDLEIHIYSQNVLHGERYIDTVQKKSTRWFAPKLLP